MQTAFLEGLRRHGFTKGQNLTVDYRLFAGHVDLVSEYAAELVKIRIDVIAAAGPLAIRTVQEATKTVPILGIADDMVGQGLVHSMAHPDGKLPALASSGKWRGHRRKLAVETIPSLAPSTAARSHPMRATRWFSGARGDRLISFSASIPRTNRESAAPPTLTGATITMGAVESRVEFLIWRGMKVIVCGEGIHVLAF